MLKKLSKNLLHKSKLSLLQSLVLVGGLLLLLLLYLEHQQC